MPRPVASKIILSKVHSSSAGLFLTRKRVLGLSFRIYSGSFCTLRAVPTNFIEFLFYFWDAMSQSPSCLGDISLVANNFDDAIVFAARLDDWFGFLGGRPGEIVVVDSGSNPEAQDVYWQLFQQKKIDKLQIIRSTHQVSPGGQATSYLQDYTAGAIANKPYLLWLHTDTLPYRSGHDRWLEEAVSYLERPEVMAISSSSNLPSQHHDAWPGWYFSHQCNLNFTLMKRRAFVDAMHEYVGELIISGTQASNPATMNQPYRDVVTLLEAYIQNHNLYSLCKVESPDWTVRYGNWGEEQSQGSPEQYLAL